MALRVTRAGPGRLVPPLLGIRRGIVTERLLWWSLIGLGILGTMIFLGLFGVLLWGLFWGMPG